MRSKQSERQEGKAKSCGSLGLGSLSRISWHRIGFAEAGRHQEAGYTKSNNPLRLLKGLLQCRMKPRPRPHRRSGPVVRWEQIGHQLELPEMFSSTIECCRPPEELYEPSRPRGCERRLRSSAELQKFVLTTYRCGRAKKGLASYLEALHRIIQPIKLSLLNFPPPTFCPTLRSPVSRSSLHLVTSSLLPPRHSKDVFRPLAAYPQVPPLDPLFAPTSRKTAHLSSTRLAPDFAVCC